MVLLIVDTQKLITAEKVFGFGQFVSGIKALISAARSSGTEVIYIRHDDGPGQALTRGTEGYDIYEGFAPLPGERIFDKTVNSPFRDSGLLEYLKEKREKQLIVTGLQTEYCIDATVKCGFEHGFEMIVPEGCNSTTDNPHMSAEKTYAYYNSFIWKNRYARCLQLEDVLDMLGASAGVEP
ncbi:MAG: cysteine hydrolase [Ruminococcus sp.]|nr:cysteine hydrolase [Ruminococcus sp.]